MRDRRLVAIPCRLSPGMFPSERFFEVQLANGKQYISYGPRYFCWNAAGQLVREDEPSKGEEIEGKIAAHRLDELPDGQTLVEVPDGEAIWVDSSLVGPRPTEISPDVLV